MAIWKCSPLSLQRWQISIMRVPSAAAKIWWPCSRLCLRPGDSGFFFSFFVFLPKVLTSWRSLARRGQPCLISALTVAQLFWIQSLDTQSDQTKLWTIIYSILSLLFKDANFICPEGPVFLWCLRTLSKCENGGPSLWLVWQLYFKSRCSSIDVSLLI